MGIGVRIFLITDDNSLERFPMRRYERLLRHDPVERLPHCAGKRVRYALVVLEIEQRKPVAILRIQCSFLQFDSEGRLDIKEQEREARLAVELFPPLPEKEHPHSSSTLGTALRDNVTPVSTSGGLVRK